MNTSKFSVSGDTTINNHVYKKYYRTSSNSGFSFERASYFAAVREDSSKRIWAIRSETSVERLQYDFSLEIGDTVTVFAIDYNAFWSAGSRIEISYVDSILIGEKYHKQYTLVNIYGILESWIEGIGSTMGLFNSGGSTTGIVDVGYPELLCFESDTTIAYFTSGNTCYKEIWIGLEDLKKYNPGPKFSPNPFHGTTVLTIENINGSDFSLEIYNMTGQLIRIFKIPHNNFELNLSGFSEGIYIYQLKSHNRNIATGKLNLQK